MASACNRAFATPKIVKCISHSLDFKTITVAVRVCRVWNSLWLPLIWSTINNGRQWHNDDFLEALVRHGNLIRSLQCSRYDDISLLISDPFNGYHCKNLVTLVLPETTRANQLNHAKIIQQNPGLLDLSLAFFEEPSTDFGDLIQAVCGLTKLRRLAFDDNHTLYAETLETTLQACSSLEELSLKGVFFFLKHPFGNGDAFASKWLATSDTDDQTAPAELSHDVPEQEKPSFLGIKSLRMENVACSQNLLLNLTSRFPNLETLSLESISEVCFSEDFPSRLVQRIPNIKWLDISNSEEMDDPVMAGLIRGFSKLQTLKVGESRFSEESLNALIACCPELEELDIRETYGIESDSIQRLFESCKSLKSLNAWDTYVNVPKMILEAYKSQPTKESATLPSSENSIVGSWICRGLESLTLSFCYDPSSLTSQEQTLIPPASARRYLLEQLSTLTNLKNLSIRTEYYESSGDDDEEDEDNTDESNNSESVMQQIQQDMSQLAVKDALDTKEKEEDGGRLFNIAFTLSTGLSILSPLKQLQSLVLYGIDHAVGVQDIQWMCQHWPKLNRIEGLYWNEDYDEDKLVLSWLQENKPKIAVVE